MLDILFSFSRNKNFPYFFFYQKDQLDNFFYLVNYAVFRASLFGRVFFYCPESEMELFRKSIYTAKVNFRAIPENETFFWAASKFQSVIDFIGEFRRGCLHIDLDLFLVKKFIFSEPDFIISHGEPYSERGLQELKNRNIPESCHQGYYNDMRESMSRDGFGKEITDILETGYALNTSLYGGYNIDLLSEVSRAVLEFVDSMNDRVLGVIDQDKDRALLYTAIAEQAFLAYFCKKNGILPASYGWPGNYLHFFSHTKIQEEFRLKMKNLYIDNRYLSVDPDVYFGGQP